jgi:tryptophan synthase/tryptophan synthase beta chain
MKLKKGKLLIDQHDKNGFWGGKFGGNFIPETLKKPIGDLTVLFERLRRDKNFLKERDYYYTNWVHKGPTPFIKLENLTKYLGGAQVWAKVVSEARGGAHKIYGAITAAMLCKRMGKNFWLPILVPVITEKCSQ